VAQGVGTAWASRVGSDPFGRKVVADLQRGGVDVGAVRVDEECPTGMYLKDSRPDGSTFMHYYRAGSAAARMDVADVAELPLDRVSWVHVSGITLAISASSARMVEALIDACRTRGVRVSFDVNFRPRLWSAAVAADILSRVAQLADLVFVGLDEAEALWGTLSAEDVFACLDLPPLVVVKNGDVGAWEVDRRGEGPIVTFESTPPVDVVEVIGAGDAFAGGYLAGLIRAEDARSRLRRGHASAAWTIGSWDDVRPGHRPAPFSRTSPEEAP
jgi:2-dehydro-3-deoxygluconokinase